MTLGCLVFLDPESTAGRAAHHRSVHHGWTTGLVLGHTREHPLSAVVADLISQFPHPHDDLAGTGVGHHYIAGLHLWHKHH